MTGDSHADRPRRTARLATPLVLLVIVSVVLGGAFAGQSTAVSSPRTSISGAPIQTVYLGEELNVTQLGLSGGGTVGSGSVTFVGVAGDAEGTIETDDAASVDLSNWATGTYDADDDGQAELSVARPRVTDVALELDNGANVTNGRAPTDEQVTLTAEFSFDEADGLDVEVVDPDGLDVAPSVASATAIDSNGGSVTLDFSDAEPGRYVITVEARNLDASRSVTLDVGTARLRLTLDRGTVVQGEEVRATVSGDPGERYVLRIPVNDLDGLSATDAAAEQVFGTTDTVTGRLGSPAQDVVYATLELDDDGEASVLIRSEALLAGNTADLDLGRGTNPSASTVLAGSLRVEAPATTTTATPTTTTTEPPTTTAPTTTEPSTTTTAAPATTEPSTTTASPTTTEPAGGQPGFGLLAGVAGALAGALLMLRRRR